MQQTARKHDNLTLFVCSTNRKRHTQTPDQCAFLLFLSPKAKPSEWTNEAKCDVDADTPYGFFLLLLNGFLLLLYWRVVPGVWVCTHAYVCVNVIRTQCVVVALRVISSQQTWHTTKYILLNKCRQFYSIFLCFFFFFFGNFISYLLFRLPLNIFDTQLLIFSIVIINFAYNSNICCSLSRCLVFLMSECAVATDTHTHAHDSSNIISWLLVCKISSDNNHKLCSMFVAVKRVCVCVYGAGCVSVL